MGCAGNPPKRASCEHGEVADRATRSTRLESTLLAIAGALLVASVVWFVAGDAGQRHGQELLVPAALLVALVVVLRRGRGAPR